MAEQQTDKTLHILLFPFPSQGHMNPIIEFGKRLISKGVKVTLVPTIYISNTFISHNSTTTSSLEIKPISDGFDEPGFAGASSFESYLEKFEEVGSKSLGDLIMKLQREGNAVDAIYESFITWAMDVAVEFGIKGGAFFTQACAVNYIYYHVYKGLISIPLGSSVSVPGLPQLEYWETPSFIHNDGPNPSWINGVFNQFANIDQARWVFTNTFYKLEEEVIDWMKKMWPLKVIGPTLPSIKTIRRRQRLCDESLRSKQQQGWTHDFQIGVAQIFFRKYQ